MKKRSRFIRLLFLMLFITILASSVYAKWIYSEKAKGYYYYDEASKTLLKSCTFLIDDKYYYFTDTGKMLSNGKAPNGSNYNANGEWEENGVVITSEIFKSMANANTTNVVDTSKSAVINAPTTPDTTIGSNIINTTGADMDASDGGSRMLKSYISSKQNVEILDEKTINGEKKKNVMEFKGNEAYISLKTNKYNKLTIRAERIKSYSSSDTDIRLALIVNGDEEDCLTFEDGQYVVSQTFTYGLNDDVDLVLYTNSENSYSSSNKVYITSGRLGRDRSNDD